jgi:hypothetical protein
MRKLGTKDWSPVCNLGLKFYVKNENSSIEILWGKAGGEEVVNIKEEGLELKELKSEFDSGIQVQARRRVLNFSKRSINRELLHTVIAHATSSFNMNIMIVQICLLWSLAK